MQLSTASLDSRDRIQCMRVRGATPFREGVAPLEYGLVHETTVGIVINRSTSIVPIAKCNRLSDIILS